MKSNSSLKELTEKKEETDEKDSSNDPTVLLSGRNDFFKKTYKRYSQSSVIDKTVGLGYISHKKGILQESKLVEIDYFDVFFCHGILGTLIYIIPLAIFIIISIKRFFIKFKNNIKNYTLIFII